MARWSISILAALLVAGIAVAMATRPARFSGQPVDHWIDTLGPLEQTNLRSILHQHPTRQLLASAGPKVIPALEREVRGSVDVRLRSRKQYQGSVTAWAFLGRVFPGRLGIRPPALDQTVEDSTRRRIHWGSALSLDLGPDAETALDRLDALAKTFPPEIRLDLSASFGAITDPHSAFSGVLTNRLRSSASELLPYWVSCLGHLGDQAAHEADFVRTLAREGTRDIRIEAIKALGYLDHRAGAADFLVTNATNQPLRQAAVIALMRMGSHAAPAREFLESCLREQDVITSMFAQFALRNLGTNEVGPR